MVGYSKVLSIFFVLKIGMHQNKEVAFTLAISDKYVIAQSLERCIILIFKVTYHILDPNFTQWDL